MSKRKFAYEVKEIYKDTFLVNEFFSTMYILCGNERALVVDCGTGAGDFKSVIESVTSLPYDVVMTHSHVDHIGGRGQFSKIFVSEADAEFIHEANVFQRKVIVAFNALGGIGFSGIDMSPVKNEPTVHTVKEGYIFDLGGRTVKVFETPGHTVGSISLLDVESRNIFIGDVSNEFLFMWLPHCTTIEKMIETHEKLLSIDGYDFVWCSHHLSCNTKRDLKKYLAGAKLLREKKNGVVPIVKIKDFEGAKIIYRANVIH